MRKEKPKDKDVETKEEEKLYRKTHKKHNVRTELRSVPHKV